MSKLQPAIISFAAFSISAVSSTKTGGFPAPAPIAFLPLDITVFTTPGPPVATTILILGFAIIFSVFSYFIVLIGVIFSLKYHFYSFSN